MLRFHEQRLRILFVLKDGNDDVSREWSSQTDLRVALPTLGRWATWGEAARWTALLLEGASWESVSSKSIGELSSYLERFAVVNLKKEAGGTSSVDREIKRYVLEDADFIREQIALYKPHLTIAGGTHKWLKRIYDLGAPAIVELGEGLPGEYYYTKEKNLGILIDFYHPAHRSSPDWVFRRLKALAKHLRSEQLIPEPCS